LIRSITAMRRIFPATLLLLTLLAFAAAPAAAQSANGVYQFTMEDEFLKYVEFDAKKQADGSTSGAVFISDDATVDYTDLDGTGDRALTGSYKGFYVKADVDDLVTTKTRTGSQAVMSGTVRDSSIPDLVGRRVLLTVEDNGDNTKVPDRVMWGFYKFEERTWTPSDYEWKTDPGVGLRWCASDYERKGDPCIPYPPENKPASTQSFPSGSYPFVDAHRPSGDIVVVP
jgi:hypothetical protein